MKRPEGFDSASEPAAPPSKRSRAQRGVVKGEKIPLVPTAQAPASPSAPTKGTTHGTTQGTTEGRGWSSTAAGSGGLAPARDAERRLRHAARARRRDEKTEVRRFTRRSRRRRVTWLVVAGIAVAMGALLAVAVYSPLLALRTITIEGTSRLSSAEVHAAVDGQLDTPLALIDFPRITRELGRFPLIRSYVTEAVPPDTLVIHVVERQPIGQLASATRFTLVDPAGITIETSETRTAGVPLIETGGQPADSAAFSAAVEVLVALPTALLAQLDTVTAATTDNVHLTLVGNGAQIIWGSAENSAYKARVLAAALKNFPTYSEYNVSAPGQLTYR